MFVFLLWVWLPITASNSWHCTYSCPRYDFDTTYRANKTKYRTCIGTVPWVDSSGGLPCSYKRTNCALAGKVILKEGWALIGGHRVNQRFLIRELPIDVTSHLYGWSNDGLYMWRHICTGCPNAVPTHKFLFTFAKCHTLLYLLWLVGTNAHSIYERCQWV